MSRTIDALSACAEGATARKATAAMMVLAIDAIVTARLLGPNPFAAAFNEILIQDPPSGA